MVKIHGKKTKMFTYMTIDLPNEELLDQQIRNIKTKRSLKIRFFILGAVVCGVSFLIGKKIYDTYFT